MKRLLFIFCLLNSTLVFAADIQTLKALYAEKAYQQAYQQAQVFLKRKPMSLRGQMILADSAYYLGLSDEAMAAYDRVLMLSPYSVSAKIQMAKLYLKAKTYRLASLELNSLANSRLSTKQKQEIAKLRKTLASHVSQKSKSKKTNKKQPHRKPFANIGLNLGLLYDSNVNSDIGKGVYKFPFNNQIYNGANANKKFAHFENININKNIKLSESFGLFTYLDLYNKNYIKHDAKVDLAYIALGLSPSYRLHKFKISWPLRFNRIFLDYNGYLNNYVVGMDVKRALSDGLIEAGYQYTQSRFDGENKKRDSNSHGLYAGFKYRLFSNVSQFVRVDYSKNKENKDLKRTDINSSSYGLNVGVDVMLSESLIGKLKLGLAKYAQDRSSKVFLSKRTDRIYNLAVGLGYVISKQSALNLDVNYMIKKSNQFVFEYNKLVIPFSYSYRF